LERILSGSNKKKKALKIVLLLTSAYFVIQIVVGFRVGSLAVISDAGHMLIDSAGLVIALLAIRFTQKPATPARTYGFYRAEILASLLNSIFLILLAVFITFEAVERILHPSEISGIPMIIVASIGLGINLLGMRLLRNARVIDSKSQDYAQEKHNAAAKEDLNLHGAYLEVLADTIGSVGVIVAGIIIQTTGAYLADPLISIGIVALILPRTWLLLKKAIHILIEGTPAHLCHEEIKQAILRVRGVTGVFDLHIWTISLGIHSLSAHVVVIDNKRAGAVLQEINSILEKDYDITHATIQVEPYHESTNI
jgi:cobalt-zinc-cadmium efflux system protein